MDFVENKIIKEINYLQKDPDRVSDLLTNYQSLLEYIYILTLGYLWNKNIQVISEDNKSRVFKLILRPTIGQVLEICKILDFNKEIFKNQNIITTYDRYPKLRNDSIGHKYTYEKDKFEIIQEFRKLYESFKNLDLIFMRNNIDLVYVKNKPTNNFTGKLFNFNGDYDLWTCNENTYHFNTDNLYLMLNVNNYYRISPFIIIDEAGNIFIFCNIKEKQIGRIEYNKVFQGEKYLKDWEDIESLYFNKDGIREKSFNGTIVNIFKKNYKKYYDFGVKDNLHNFLIKNRSSVCAIVCGHGGVGKTALVQSICEDFKNNQNKYFDYIIFLTAKNRSFNIYKGKIDQETPTVTAYGQIISLLNKIINDVDSEDDILVSETTSKILIVVDDFESFEENDKRKIKAFISKLNASIHKVIITTRIADTNGEQFPTNELDKNQTILFLKNIIENSNPNLLKYETKLESSEIINKVYLITTGRPLFIFYLANVIAQKPNIEEATSININSIVDAREFLFGRVYDYLKNQLAKDIFVCLSLIISEKNLTNSVDKLKIILETDGEIDNYQLEIALKDLEFQKIIEFNNDRKIFEVYSGELIQIMKDYFEDRNDDWKAKRKNKAKQIEDIKDLGVHQTILKSLKSDRETKNETEVINNYRSFLNRIDISINLKIEALSDLIIYYRTIYKRVEGIRYLTKIHKDFNHNSDFIILSSNYHWEDGSEEEKKYSLKIINEYISKNINLSEDNRFELMSILTNRECSLFKKSLKNNDDKLDYNEEIPTEIIKDTYNNGERLFEQMKLKKIDLPYKIVSDVCKALISFVDFCIINKKIEIGNEICAYMMKHSLNDYRKRFESKISEIQKLKK